MNAFGTEHIGLQLGALIAGILAYKIITLLAYKKACRDFETIDL